MEGKHNLLKAGLVIVGSIVLGGVAVILLEQHVFKTKPKTV